MARRKLPRPTSGRRRREYPRFDMDFYFETGFESRVAEGLQSEVPTRRILELFGSEQERQTLILLLCHVVFCREQQLKTDDVIERMAGTRANNIENARNRIETFCQWLWLHLHSNYDLRSVNEARTVIPTLLNIADVIADAVPTGRMVAQDWNQRYVEALDSLERFIETTKTRKPYTVMAKLLEESARALGKNQTYEAHTILVRIKAHRSQ